MASLSSSSFLSSSSSSVVLLLIIILNIGDGDCNIIEGTFYEGNLRLSRDLGATVEAAAAAPPEEWERKALTGISPFIITSNINIIVHIVHIAVNRRPT